MSRRASLLALTAVTLLLSACGEEKVSTYRVPKEKDPEMPAAAQGDASAPGDSSAPSGSSMADTAVPTASGSDLAWTAPSDWVAKPPAPMRKASFSVPAAGSQAELSVTAFPGEVGGELANVNRWRSQIGLTPLKAEDLDASVSRQQANGLDFTIVELAPGGGDPNGKAILGAIVPFQGSTWFFKLIGSGPAVKAAKAPFIVFLRSVHPAAGADDAAQVAAPAAAPSMAETPVPTASGAELTWSAPADWVVKPPAPMRKATFGVPAGGVQAELSVTAFPGDVGGELANVNRWRSQIGLTPLKPEELDASVSHQHANGLDVTIVELAPGGGDPNGKAILGAIVPFQGSTWFFKLTGPGTALKAAKEPFNAFLRSVQPAPTQ
jgi:hypothetical protein